MVQATRFINEPTSELTKRNNPQANLIADNQNASLGMYQGLFEGCDLGFDMGQWVWGSLCIMEQVAEPERQAVNDQA